MYTGHVTFADQPVMRSVVEANQAVLGGLPGLVMVPFEWTHLTVQGWGSPMRWTGPLRETRFDPVGVELGRIDLLALEQTDHLYRWDVAATAPFGARTGW